MTTLRVAAAAISFGFCVTTADAQREPRQTLDSSRAHIWVLMPAHWDLRLFATAELTGHPVIHLTDAGLFVDGKSVCSWPGGRYDRANEPNMVLGYRDLDSVGKRSYEGCAISTPVISTWGDGGTGTAAVFLEVIVRRGHLVELPFGDRRVYLDLNSLPGDPETPISGLARPSGGFTGWIWMPAMATRRTSGRGDLGD